MHCETNSVWPTAAAAALIEAFPDIAGEANKNGLTAQQTFDQDIDAEEERGAVQLDKSGAQTGSTKKPVRDQFGAVNAGTVDNAAAARAGTMTRRRASLSEAQIRSWLLSLDQGLSLAPFFWLCLCSRNRAHEEEVEQGAVREQRAQRVRLRGGAACSARGRVLGVDGRVSERVSEERISRHHVTDPGSCSLYIQTPVSAIVENYLLDTDMHSLMRVKILDPTFGTSALEHAVLTTSSASEQLPSGSQSRSRATELSSQQDLPAPALAAPQQQLQQR